MKASRVFEVTYRSLPLLIALILAFSACKRDETSPEATAERFFANVRAKDATSIWNGLTDDSRKQLRDRHEALAEATGDPVDPKAIVAGLGLTALADGKNPVVVSPLGDRVTVRTSGPLGSTDLHLVREGGTWKVDLMRSLTSSVTNEHP